MAIQWDGGGERCDYPNPGDLNTGPFTVAVRFEIQSPPQSGNQYFLAIKNAAAAIGFIVWLRDAVASTSIAVTQLTSGTSRFRYTNPVEATINTAGYHTLVITGTAGLAASGITIRLDGSEPGYELTQDGTGVFPALTGILMVAGRDSDNLRDLVARTADLTIAQRIWSLAEIQAYEAGLPGEYVQPADIIYETRFLNGSTLDRISGSSGTVSGTPVASAQPNHVASIGSALSRIVSLSNATNSSPASDDRFATVTTALSGLTSSAVATNTPPVVVTTTMTDEYEGGNSDVLRAVITNATSLTPNVRMWARPGVNVEGATPAAIYYTAAWRLDGVLNKTPTMELSLSDPLLVYGAGGFPAGWRLWYAYDDPEDLNANWQRVANTSVSGGFQQMSHNAPFTQDRVYCSTRPDYGNTKTRAWLDAQLPSSIIKMPPSSAGNNHVYAQSAPTARDGDGLAVPALNLLSFLIEDDSLQPPGGIPKRTILALGRLHASEPQGGWILEGSLGAALGNDARGILFRTHCRLLVLPIINTSGAWGNAYRGTLQAGQRDQDPNRDWPGGATAGLLDVVTAARSAITLDTQNAISAVLDYHGRIEIDNSLFYRELGGENQAFYNALNARYTTVSVPTGDGIVGSSTRYYGVSFDVPVHAIPEGDGVLANGVQDLTEFTLFGEAQIDAINDRIAAGGLPVRGANAGSMLRTTVSAAAATNSSGVVNLVTPAVRTASAPVLSRTAEAEFDTRTQ